MGTELTLADERFDSRTSQRLVGALLEDMQARYGVEEVAGVHPSGADFIAFLVGRSGGEAVCCGGITRFDVRTAEVKRMYVVPEARGRGYSRVVLAELERRAAELGYERIRLETGLAQPEALALYASAGFEAIPCWAPYLDDPHSRCFEKRLER